MSHRIGVCSSCGAQYKLPATFSADRARCKQCDGVVEIGPPVEPEPEAAPPVPAEPAPVEVKKKKREGPSMKERLLAERQAAEAAAAKPVPARKPASRGTVSKKSAPKRDQRPDKRTEKPTAKTGVRSSRSSAPAKSRKGRSRRRGDDEDDEGEERGSRRHGRAASRRRPKKSPMVPFFLALIAFVFVGAGVWYMFFGPGATPEPIPEEVADAGQDPEGTGDLASTEGVGEEATPEETTPDEPEETAPEETTPEEPVEKPKPVPGDPNSVDLTAFPDYGPIDGCSEDRFIELKQLAAEMTDPMSGAAGTRARIKLEKAGKEAFPVIVNRMKKLNLFDEDDFTAGDMCQKTLQTICNGMNAGWYYPDTNPDDYVYLSKKATALWCRTWESVKDNEEKWLKLTKQTGKKVEETKPTEEDSAIEDELDELDDL